MMAYLGRGGGGGSTPIGYLFVASGVMLMISRVEVEKMVERTVI